MPKGDKTRRLNGYFTTKYKIYGIGTELYKRAAAAVGTSTSYAKLTLDKWLATNDFLDQKHRSESLNRSIYIPRCSNGRPSQKFHFDDSKLFK